jgi:hypothetical protein
MKIVGLILLTNAFTSRYQLPISHLLAVSILYFLYEPLFDFYYPAHAGMHNEFLRTGSRNQA